MYNIIFNLRDKQGIAAPNSNPNRQNLMSLIAIFMSNSYYRNRQFYNSSRKFNQKYIWNTGKPDLKLQVFQ